MDDLTWKVLQIDDDEDDFVITRDLLRETHYHRIDLEWAATYAEGLQALAERTFDAVLVDYDLGERTGIDLIEEAVRRGVTAPFLLVTGRGSYEVDLRAMEAGAVDYLNKSEINGPFLERSIRYAIEMRHTVEKLEAANAELLMANTAVAEQQAWLQRQEGLLEQLFHQSPVGLAVVSGPELRFEMYNPAYQAMLVEPGLIALGKPLVEVLDPDSAASAVRDLSRVMETGEPLRMNNVEFRAPDGSMVYISIHLLPLEWDNTPAALLVVWDTSDQMRIYRNMERYLHEAEERAAALEKAEARLRYQAALLEAVSDAVIACDNDYRVTCWNQGAQSIYGWTAEEALGRHVFEVVPAEMAVEDRQQVWRELAEKGFYRGQVVHRDKAGRRVTVESRGLALLDSSGQPIGYVAVNREVEAAEKA